MNVWRSELPGSGFRYAREAAPGPLGPPGPFGPFGPFGRIPRRGPGFRAGCDA